jgi:hypothetical protein
MTITWVERGVPVAVGVGVAVRVAVAVAVGVGVAVRVAVAVAVGVGVAVRVAVAVAVGVGVAVRVAVAVAVGDAPLLFCTSGKYTFELSGTVARTRVTSPDHGTGSSAEVFQAPLRATNSINTKIKIMMRVFMSSFLFTTLSHGN